MEITISSPTYGPDGVGRKEDGKVLFVRHAVPGDRVRVSITEEKKSHALARVEELLEPSPHRCEAACPAHPECGGCPWMHVDRQAQLAFKRDVLLGTLRNVADESAIEPLLYDAGGDFGYRQRARLHLEAGPGASPRVGFFSHGTNQIVPIEACPICRPALSQVITRLAAMRFSRALSGSMELVMDDEDRVLAMLYLARPVEDPDGLAAHLLEHAGPAGVAVSGPARVRAVAGLESSHQTTQSNPHCTIPVFPGAFTQANRGVNQMLVAHVVETVSQLFKKAEVVELYAGHGNFSYPLASADHRVAAVEVGLRTNLLTRNPNVHFMKGDTAHILKTRLKNRKPDVILLDPPRQGAKDAIAPITNLKPPAIVYVSCDPNTFARDAAMLSKQGYRLTSVTPFDMMPQTYHVEVVGTFER